MALKEEAKAECVRLARLYGLDVTFDDEYENFGCDNHRAVLGGSMIEYSKFYDRHYDLLVLCVLHELGHYISAAEVNTNKIANSAKPRDEKHVWAVEYEAWKIAINLFIDEYGKNISVKMARFIMDCLNSYLPNFDTWKIDATNKDTVYERESTFWCPLQKKIILN